MSNQNDIFVSRNIALKLKANGFKESCFGYYSLKETPEENLNGGICLPTSWNEGYTYLAKPMYQQVIDWFEREYQKYIYVFKENNLWKWKIDTEHGCDCFNKGSGFNSKYLALNDAINEAFNLI